MGKLVLSLNGAVQGEYPLDRERITIGRKSDNSIQIDNLAVSGKHALVITILDDSFLEDLGSTNGTYVNGKLIKKHALRDGDVIGIGKHELKYQNENASSSDEAFEKAMILRPSPSVPPPAPKPGAGVPAAVGTPAVSAPPTVEAPGGDTNEDAATVVSIGRVRVLDGPMAGRSLDLVKPVTTIGKPGVQVAIISRRPRAYVLTHVEGDAGQGRFPLVNGQSIGQEPRPLAPGDIIEIAGVRMEFSLHS